MPNFAQNLIDNFLGRTMNAGQRALIVSDLSEPETKASQVLTGAVGDVSADETITIGSTVITIEDTASTANSIVKATDLSVADTCTSIKEFINGELPSATGVTFNGRTFDEAVTAVNDATTVTITANAAGVAGNTIATTETLTTGAFGAATLAGAVGKSLSVTNILTPATYADDAAAAAAGVPIGGIYRDTGTGAVLWRQA